MTYDEYLAHHGILGMKWGKRNGPPYPLTSQQMSTKEKAKNDVSEYSAKVRLTKRKEREAVRKAKFKEREATRHNKVQEKEEARQNRVYEREQIRQHKVDEKEWTRQAVKNYKYSEKEYKAGRKFVRNRLIGLGVMALVGYKIVSAKSGG